MKTKTMICATVILSPLFIAWLTPFFGAYAQSGAGAPTPLVKFPNGPEAEMNGVINQDADKYKLIFSRGYEDPFLYTVPPGNRKERKRREKERGRDAKRRAE